ncbi:uncharacterized protein TEOVI_000431400 [Trypanosoma equiperdum]|uniref:Uncharacterized protein n=1 Tax=Trypanosoma equiperdum TaxID=5694 RepID=A0A1G4IK34_TRYEQ|nr:hypothetical protein TEOVI_000431400 [Trypanosoma equiperdum]
MKAKGEAAKKQLIAKTQSSSGNKCKHNTIEESAGDSNGNICIVSGPVTTRKTYEVKRDQKDYGTGNRGSFNSGKFEHYAQDAAKETHDIMCEIQSAKTNFNPDDLTSYTADEDVIAAVGLVFLGHERNVVTADNVKAVQDTIKSNHGTGKEITTKF